MSRKSNDPWVRIFNVSDPVLHKKGFTLYKVTSKVFPRNFIEAETQVTVWKRYNDFKKLHKSLFTLHQGLYIRDPFPPFAKARFFGRFHEHVIEERKKSALQLLEFAAKHPPLFTSQVFVKFFEEGKNLEFVSTEVKINHAEVLQPLECNKAQSLVPSFSNAENERIQNENTEHKDSLGGIWKHHQVADEISLSSQATEGDDEEDDRTTFTDDDHSICVPSLDVSEFDPLREDNDPTKSRFLTDSRQEDFCNDWLLSALQSCVPPDADRLDLECSLNCNTLEFPKPFGDFEDFDTPLLNVTNQPKSPKHEIFKDSSVVAEQNLDAEHYSHGYYFSEFDPLVNSAHKDVTQTDIADISELQWHHPTSSSETDVLDHESYMIEAANFIVEAHEAETLANYMSAFSCYKSAINILLQGVQKEPCTKRKEAVRRKILQYLLRAEEIYENHLPMSDEKKCKEELSIPFSPLLEARPLTLRGSMEDLSKFKVLGVLKRVLLVLDITNGKTFVVKTLHKSSSPKPDSIPNIVPQDSPFMVQLYQVYETCHALFLILQFASGGRVWDYVGSYFQRSPNTPNKEFSAVVTDPQEVTDLSNVYSGKKLSRASSYDKNQNMSDQSNFKTVTSEVSLISVDSDLTPAAECPPSYVALFKNYLSSDDNDEIESSINLSQENVTHAPENNNMDQNDSVIHKNADADINLQVHDPNVSKYNNSKYENLDGCKFGDHQLHMVKESTCRYPYKENKVAQTSVYSKNVNCISCDTNTLDEIILNSKTLIENVDKTMSFSQNVLLLSEEYVTDTTAVESDCCNNSSSEIKIKAQNIQDTFNNCDILGLTSDLSQSECGTLNSTGHQWKENENRHPSNKQPLSTDIRSRLSSSTGSLELAFSHRVCFSEAFREMDKAISQAAANPVHLPESCVSVWAAEIVIALHSLHSLGIIWQDLHPGNLLLGTEGHILLTYKSEWNCVDKIISNSAKDNFYAAPEIGNVFPLTSSCDWWSLGALLFELLTGRTLASCHPGGITSHTALHIPPGISSEATDLLKKLLVYDASERLGAGPLGVEDIKAHPFFLLTDWKSLHKR